MMESMLVPQPLPSVLRAMGPVDEEVPDDEASVAR
jgi:hypothetical protein